MPRLRVPASYAGAACATVGVALLMLPGLAWAAIGLELVALAFWLWARSLPDRSEQLARWGWLRRPPRTLPAAQSTSCRERKTGPSRWGHNQTSVAGSA